MGTSDDAANAIIFGTDGGLYAPASLPLTGGTLTGRLEIIEAGLYCEWDFSTDGNVTAGSAVIGERVWSKGDLTVGGRISLPNGPGTAGQCIVSGGPGANASWATPPFLPLTGGTVTGSTTFQGATNVFAQGSINSTAWGPLVIVTETVSGTIDATDAGKVLVAAPAVNLDLTLTLPAAGTAAVKPGMVVELVSNVPTTGKYFYIQAPAGVSLFFNSTVGGSGDGTLGGGAGARVRLRGPMTSARLLAVDASTWWAFGELVGA
jgi:hypothetical protein